MYISLWENSWGHPDNISFMQFSTKIDGFKQNDSQGFENSYNSYEQYPLENFFIFTIYQNYTLALIDHSIIDSLSSIFTETCTHLSMQHYFYVASYITGTQYLHVRHQTGKDISSRICI